MADDLHRCRAIVSEAATMNGLRVAAIALAAIASAPAWGQEALTPGTYEEDNPNVVYSGKWIHQTREGPTKKTIRTTVDHAAAIDFRIRGTAFEIGVLTYDDRSVVSQR